MPNENAKGPPDGKGHNDGPGKALGHDKVKQHGSGANPLPIITWKVKARL